MFTKAFAWDPTVHHGSVNPLPQEFRIGCPWVMMTWSSSLNRWRNCMRSWSSGKPIWKERDVGSTWAKPKFCCLGMGSMCFRSLSRTPVACVSRVSAHTAYPVVVVPANCIHKKCSGAPASVRPDPRYSYKLCTGQARPIDGRPMTEGKVGREKIKVVTSFYYIGNFLSSGAGCILAIITRCHIAWGKFNELLSVFTCRSFPITSRGKVYN